MKYIACAYIASYLITLCGIFLFIYENESLRMLPYENRFITYFKNRG